VVSVEPETNSNRVLLGFQSQKGPSLEPQAFDHVIFALPKSALVKLSANFDDHTTEALDHAYGFPLLKAFMIKAKPWWSKAEYWNNQYPKELAALVAAGRLPVASQLRTGAVPTRELHYFYNKKQDRGMVMVYTDRPATEYWRNMIQPGDQDRAEVHKAGSRKLRAQLLDRELIGYLGYEGGEAAVRLDLQNKLEELPQKSPFQSLVRAASATDLIRHALTILSNESIDAGAKTKELRSIARDTFDVYRTGLVPRLANESKNLLWSGLRDWSREPYGGACHAWRPGVRWWVVQKSLAAFGLRQSSVQNLHVCGEAYSDWHGFIEGALATVGPALRNMCDATACDSIDTGVIRYRPVNSL
jgi:hypothetical protein